MKRLSALALGLVLFLLGCGGGGGGGSGTPTVITEATDAELATDAVASAPWSAETVVESTTTQKTTANNNVQYLLSSVLAQASAKKSRSSSKNLDATVTGGTGSASVVGTVEVTTPESGTFPVVSDTDVTIEFDGYEDTTFSLHGKVEYSGSTTATAIGSYETNFTSHGGYSYKDSTGVYSFSTQMDVTITLVNNAYSGTYSFVVNGVTVSGTF